MALYCAAGENCWEYLGQQEDKEFTLKVKILDTLHEAKQGGLLKTPINI